MNSASKTVLCLDTTTSRLMIGLSRDNELIAQVNVPCDSHRYHSALMIPAIDDILKAAGVPVRDVSALAVNAGPGSFTGIRTGIITARTMAQFMEVPVYLFNHFELLAFDLLAVDTEITAEQPIAVYLDALRGRAYHTVLSFSESGPVYHQVPALSHIDADAGLTDSQMQTGWHYLVSQPLASFFGPERTRLISPDFFSPAAMVSLFARYGDFYAKNWREVRPLYLQEPSITLRKQPPVAG